MRKTPFMGSLTVVFLALCLAALPAWAVERCVLAELMTWIPCHQCPEAEATWDSLTQEYHDSCLAIIRYHPVNAPSEPFYQPESYSRFNGYYGQWTLPKSFFDGGLMVSGADDSSYFVFKDSIEYRRSIPSPLSMNLSVTYDTLSRGGQAYVEVLAVDPVGAVDLHLRYALIESDLIHQDMAYQEVLRDMYPDVDGVSFALGQGETFRDTVDFVLDAEWLPENCDLVVFVQDDVTKEVLQSIQRGIPLPRIPDVVEDLKAILCNSHMFLTWSPVTKDQSGHPLAVDYYRVFRDTSHYFLPGDKTFLDSTEELSYLDTTCHHIKDIQKNCSYYVTAVAGGLESTPSRVVGEFDIIIIRWK